MSITIKGAVSAAALLIAVSAAHAQTDERPQGEGRQQGGQQQMERGGQDRPEARTGDKQPDGKSERSQAGEKRDDKSAQGQATDKRDGDRSAQDKPDRDNRQGGASDRKDGPSQASRPDKADGKPEKRKISVSAEQKPRFRDAIKRHSNIKRYHRSDVHFSINLGTRVPDSFVFYDAPAEFYEIDADFREYKIIVLDDVILVVDPDTREIVEVISI